MGMLDKFNSPVSMVFGKPGKPISKEDLDAIFRHINDGSFEEFYSRFDAESVIRKIEDFKLKDYGQMGDERLSAEIRSLMVDGESLVSFPEEIALPPRAVLFRARALSGEAMEEYLSENCIPNHGLWEPPSECVLKRGRLNNPGESVFYCNFGNPFTALNEVGAPSADCYLLVAYEAVSQIKCRCIGVFEPEACVRLREASQRAYDAYHLLHDFLADEFSREVLPGDEQRYRIAKIIADDYFFFSEGCIGYPSAKKAPGLNLKMDSKYAHSNLCVRCVLLGAYDSAIEKYAVAHFSFPGRNSFDSVALMRAGSGVSIDDLFSANEAVLQCLDARGEEVTISAYLPNYEGIARIANNSK